MATSEMARRYPFVVLEGLSGTGKSTCGRIVAARLAAVLLDAPLPPLDAVRPAMDGMPLSVRYLFYLTAVAHVSEVVKTQLARTAVVCDRYVLTTQCFHQAAGLRVLDSSSLGLLEPDLTVLITCEDNVRRRRLLARGMTVSDLREQTPGLEAAFLNAYRAEGLPEVDTTGRTAEEAAEQVLRLLRARWRRPLAVAAVGS